LSGVLKVSCTKIGAIVMQKKDDVK
jgi:hypothetical protein